jgi:hypothetical protein
MEAIVKLTEVAETKKMKKKGKKKKKDEDLKKRKETTGNTKSRTAGEQLTPSADDAQA